jgi:large subunit ribosomal protein L44
MNDINLMYFKDRSRAELFVADFILTYLVGKDINEIWQIKNPMGLLTKILEENGRQAPESRLDRNSCQKFFYVFFDNRLLWATGVSSVLSTYVVGVYSNKEFLGKSRNIDLIDMINDSLF